jgi:hypothetical protein
MDQKGFSHAMKSRVKAYTKYAQEVLAPEAGRTGESKAF